LIEAQAAMLIRAIGDDDQRLPDVLRRAHVAERGSERIIEGRSTRSNGSRLYRWRPQTLFHGQALARSGLVPEWHEQYFILRTVAAKQRTEENARLVQFAAHIHAAARIDQHRQADGLVACCEEC